MLWAVCLGLSTLSYSSTEEANTRALDHFIRGTIASEVENHYQAVFHFQEALRSDPRQPFIHVALAQEYMILDQPGRALELLEDALAIDSSYTDALELKAAILRSTGKYSEAIATLETLVRADSTNYSYQYDLLFGYLSIGDFDKADELFERHIEGESDIVPLIRQILSIYALSEEYDRAIPYMNRLLKSDTLDASMMYSMGALYLQVGDTLSGESLIQRAIDLEPSEPRYWFARAVLEYERGNFEDVFEIAEAAVKAAGEQASLSNLLGNAFSRLGRTDEAIAAFCSAIALDSTHFPAMGSLALIYDGLDSLDRVVELYEKAIELSDSTPVYLNNLAYTYAERGIELEKARLLVTQALAADPENAPYLDTMGWIEYQTGNYEEAVEWLRKAIKIDAENAPLYEHLGDAYYKLGKESKARSYYRKGLARDLGNESLLRKLGQQ
ncbi:tetratricopeptide repeat protein [bacterium]|nr:tetratricopeptide repeat protein [bacterium]